MKNPGLLLGEVSPVWGFGVAWSIAVNYNTEDMTRLIQKIVPVDEKEIRVLLYAFVYFFCLLAAYYILRPLRDEMGIQGGVRNLQWLFTGTFIAILAAVPLYGVIVSRFPRRKFLPIIYQFFVLSILLFWVLFHTVPGTAWVARAFFIWLSVFNLFVVSVFWSFMADLFTKEQAKRLYGFIAAGGTCGAICGPLLTLGLVRFVGTVQLLLFSVILLEIAVFCVHRLNVLRLTEPQEGSSLEIRPIGGNFLAGFSLLFRSWYLVGIAAFIVLFTTCSTFLYFAQARIVADAFADSESRTAVFAMIDFLVNSLTLAIQIFATGHLLRRFGLAIMLIVLPFLMAVGFACLGMFPVLGGIIVFQVLRRAMNYAVNRPARESLFTVLSREEKYKAKNVIDTVVYRGGDAVSAWLFAGLGAAGLSLSAILFIGIPIALTWAVNGFLLGRKCDKCDKI